MSYILDALRRADAERERGAVPGLSSQQHAYVEDDASKPQRPRVLVWAVVALAATLLVALAWNFIGSGGSQSTPRPVVEGSVSPAPPVAPVLLPTTPSPMVQPPSPAVTTATSPDTAAAPSQGSVEPATTAPPAPAPRTVAKHSPEPKRVTRRSVEPDSASSPTATTTANTATAKVAEPKGAESKAARTQADGRVYQQAELPEEVRRDLPKLVIGGASYSGDAASRMVMINGQIFHEGDQLAPQLVLERIKLKSAVLSYKGYRYEVTF
jgi:general secretion pathway protein B